MNIQQRFFAQWQTAHKAHLQAIAEGNTYDRTWNHGKMCAFSNALYIMALEGDDAAFQLWQQIEEILKNELKQITASVAA